MNIFLFCGYVNYWKFYLCSLSCCKHNLHFFIFSEMHKTTLQSVRSLSLQIQCNNSNEVSSKPSEMQFTSGYFLNSGKSRKKTLSNLKPRNQIMLLSEMITIWFAGWISGRIVSLQPDTNIQKLLSNGNRIQIRISQTVYRYFEDSDFWKKLHIAQSFIHYLQKHLFSLLCHASWSVYGVISVP